MEERELPVGWAYFSLSELGGTKGGKTPSKSRPDFWQPETVHWTSPKDMKVFELRGSEDKISDLAISDGGMEILPAGSVLMVTRSGILSHTFPVAIARVDTAINQDIKAVKPTLEVDERFLAYSLRSLEGTILGSCSKEGTTVASVETRLLEKLPLPLAPLNEQRRIADKLDTTLAAVDSCRQRLEGVATLIKRFRQAVLEAATTGELTREWREEHGRDQEWKKVPLGDLIQEGPKNGLYKPKSAYGQGVRILRIDNFYDGSVSDWSLLKRLVLSSPEIQEYGLTDGDIVVNRVNSISHLGKTALIESLPERCVFESNMMRIRLKTDLAIPFYVNIFLCCPDGIHQLRLPAKHAVNQASINQQDVKSVRVPLPSLEEQVEIIHRAQALFSLADQLEARLTAARQVVERLTPALLAKAFRGELVPQDPSDEPASVLLARIRAARQAEAAAGKPSRRGRNKAAATPEPSLFDAAPLPPDLLSTLLRECGSLREKALLAASDLDPARFRAQLAAERRRGSLRDTVDEDGQLLLEAVG